MQLTVVVPRLKVLPELWSHWLVSTPDSVSVKVGVKVTLALPDVENVTIFAGTVTVGAAVSYWKLIEPVPWLPAASVQWPDTEAVAKSGPLYENGLSHVTPPLVVSVPVKLTVTVWLYQPFLSALLSRLGNTIGVVASILIVAVLVDSVLPALSVE